MKVTLDYKRIGARLKQLREQKGLSRGQIADALNVSDGFISQIERGVSGITLETAATLSLLYHVPIDDLILDTGYALPEIQIDKRIKEQLEKANPLTLHAISGMIDILLSQQEALQTEE